MSSPSRRTINRSQARGLKGRASVSLLAAVGLLALSACLFVRAAPSEEPIPPTLTPDAATITQRVTLSDGTRTGGEVSFVGTGFTPGAIVSIFVALPDGTIVPVADLATINANPPPPAAPSPTRP